MIKFIKFVAGLLTFCTVAAMIAIVYLASETVELPKIDGRDDILAGKIKKESLFEKVELNKNREKPSIISEESLNHYLAKNVKGMQEGYGNEWVKYKGLWVNLEKDKVQFFVEREISWSHDGDAASGETVTRQHITQFDIVIKSTTKGETKKISYEPAGAKIGAMNTPGQFGRMAKIPLDHLMETLSKEVSLYKEMVEVHVREGEIELCPQETIIVKVAPGSSGRR